MKNTAITVLALVAAMTGIAAAQTNSLQNQIAANAAPGGGGTEISRHRIIAAIVPDADLPAVANMAAAERLAFELLNQKRADNGQKALAWSDELETLARRHSQDMADHKYFAHRGLDGSMVSDRADRSGLKKWRSIGENIAYNRGYKDPIEMAVKLWMESNSHRENLLNNDWRESAVGVAVASDGSYYFTQIFLLRK